MPENMSPSIVSSFLMLLKAQIFDVLASSPLEELPVQTEVLRLSLINQMEAFDTDGPGTKSSGFRITHP